MPRAIGVRYIITAYKSIHSRVEMTSASTQIFFDDFKKCFNAPDNRSPLLPYADIWEERIKVNSVNNRYEIILKVNIYTSEILNQIIECIKHNWSDIVVNCEPVLDYVPPGQPQKKAGLAFEYKALIGIGIFLAILWYAGGRSR